MKKIVKHKPPYKFKVKTRRAEIISLLQKSDTENVKENQAAIETARRKCQSPIMVKSKGALPLTDIKNTQHDGDIEKPDELAYANTSFISANSAATPEILDHNRNPVPTRSKFCSGVYAHINLYVIKSIISLVLTGVFAYLAITGRIASDNFVDMFQIIMIFFFGTQSGKY